MLAPAGNSVSTVALVLVVGPICDGSNDASGPPFGEFTSKVMVPSMEPFAVIGLLVVLQFVGLFGSENAEKLP